MRRAMMLCAAVLCLTMTLAPTALAAGTNEVEICYPTAITQSEDGTELRKLYDLGPEDDPTGIPRSDFEQDGFHYTLTDLLRQELPDLRHQVLSQPGQSGHFQHPQDHPGQWTDPDPPDHQLADGQHSNPGRLRPG